MIFLQIVGPSFFVARIMHICPPESHRITRRRVIKMAEYKHWISYFYAYNGEIKGKNVGFVKLDVREGKCRLYLCLKGVYGFEKKGLEVYLLTGKEGKPQKTKIGQLSLKGGNGEFIASSGEENLFGTGDSLLNSQGIYLQGEEKGTVYLSIWEKRKGNLGDFLPAKKQKVQNGAEPSPACRLPAVELQEPSKKATEELQEPLKTEAADLPEPMEVAAVDLQELPEAAAVDSPELTEIAATDIQESPETAESGSTKLPGTLWDTFCRYYPRVTPNLTAQGVELLQIRPEDIRYLPRHLWHLGSNSFLLHGYYRYRQLVLGRIRDSETYILGVRGTQEERETFSANLFGFHRFLPVNQEGIAGYWYLPVSLEEETDS
jgi:hypothetical protein